MNATTGRVVHSLLDDAAAEAPDTTAVRDRDGRWTYRETVAYSHAVARWLRDNGIRAGDRVVVQLPTNRALVALFYGIVRIGAIFVPLNPAMKEFQIRSVAQNAEPSLLIVADQDTARLAAATGVAAVGIDTVWSGVAEHRAAGAVAGPSDVDTTDVAVLIYTSGSTGAPKGVICPHFQITFACAAIHAVLGFRADDVVFSRFLMSWDVGLYQVIMCALGRCAVVLAGDESDLVLLRRMREVGATVVPIVPSLAAGIVALAGRDRGEPVPVRMFTNTGAKLPGPTIERLRAAFPGAAVVRQFGQTECKRITIMPPSQDRERPDAVGLPLPGTAVLILDSDGTPLPAGTVGEIVVAGPHVMPGYWRAPELSAATFRPGPDGTPRLHTGDYGHLDEDGYLYFTGRRDDMFKRKGMRVSTLEIEAAAMDIPGIRAAAAIPPTPDRDLALCAETELEPAVVLQELARRLEPQKVPATCHVFDELPLTANGKNATRELARHLDEVAR